MRGGGAIRDNPGTPGLPGPSERFARAPQDLDGVRGQPFGEVARELEIAHAVFGLRQRQQRIEQTGMVVEIGVEVRLAVLEVANNLSLRHIAPRMKPAARAAMGHRQAALNIFYK